MSACEQGCGRTAEVYAMDPRPGGWGGRYCRPCATALRFTVTDTLQPEAAPALRVGSTVHVHVLAAGPGRGTVVGELLGLVLAASRHEADIMLHPCEVADADAREAADEVLRRADLTLEGVRQGRVYVLANCGWEDVKLVAAPPQ